MKHDLEAKRVKKGARKETLFGRDHSKVALGIFGFMVETKQTTQIQPQLCLVAAEFITACEALLFTVKLAQS